jgi:hypothetical protein
MQITPQGKKCNAEFSFKMKHCHLAVALHVEIEPEALIFEAPNLQDSSERMNKICTDAAQSVVHQVFPIIEKLHYEFLKSLEHSEAENHRAFNVS